MLLKVNGSRNCNCEILREMARGSLYELQTQIELACDLKFFDRQSAEQLLGSCVDVAKLINGLPGVLEP
jgi:four helix bundle protein